MESFNEFVTSASLANTEEAVKRLAIKRDITLGRMNRSDLILVLAMASRCIAMSERASEFAVNDALKAWLGNTGSMLRIDHVELRRTLIDYGLWERDSYGKQYWRCEDLADAQMAAQLQALIDIDPERLVADHRAALFAERARRKAMALSGSGKDL